MSKLLFLLAVIAFAIAFFIDKDQLKWITAGLAFLAGGHLLGDDFTFPFTRKAA